MPDTAQRVLTILRDLTQDDAVHIYNIDLDGPNLEPLSAAVRDWKAAGCPMLEPCPVPAWDEEADDLPGYDRPTYTPPAAEDPAEAMRQDGEALGIGFVAIACVVGAFVVGLAVGGLL